MSKCRFLAVVVGICLLSTSSSARIMKINDYLSGINVMGFYTGDGNKNPTLPMESCASIGGTTTKPAGTTCSTKEINGKTCYYNCTCSSAYQYTSSNCAKPKQLSGSRCGGKYTACSCPASYQYTSSNCASPKTLSGEQCGGKYTKCECPSSYQYDSSNCDSIKLSGEQCGSKYTKCECPSSYQYTCENGLGNGTACDGKYQSCAESSSSSEPEQDSCANNVSRMTGALFDGQANTTALIEANQESSLGAKAAAAAYKYYPADAVEQNDETWGQHKWYLPAVGEVLTMLDIDWDALDFKDMSEKVSEGIKYGAGLDTFQVKEFSSGENFEKINSALTAAGKPGLGGKIWTSSEASADAVYAFYGPDEMHITKKETERWFVRPVIKVTLSEKSELPEVGMYVNKDLVVTGAYKEDSTVGVIYWVSPQNPLTVRIVSFNTIGQTDGSPHFFSQAIDIAKIVNDPWTCSASAESGSCDFDYINFTGPLFDGEENTQKILAEREDKAIAAYATSQFYHPLVEKDDPLFGQGKWYLPSIAEAIQLNVCAWEKMGADGIFSKMATKLTDGTFTGELPEFADYCLEANDPDTWKYLDANMRLVSKYYTEQVSAPDMPIWTSNEFDGKSAWFTLPVMAVTAPKTQTDNAMVLPMVKVNGDFSEANIGDGVGATGELLKPEDDPASVVAIIIWVAPDKQSVRAVSTNALVFSEYEFKEDNPFLPNNNNSYEDFFVPWDLEEGYDIEALTNNPFMCTTASDGCGSQYIYNQYNCTYPKSLGGESCGDNYTKCTCPSNYNKLCSPLPGVGDSCNGYYSTCGTCGSQYVYTSSNCRSPKVLGGERCGSYYTTCSCPSSYNQDCGSYSGVGTACDGKYQSCSSECSSGYDFDSSNCPSPMTLSGDICGGKYKKCFANSCDVLYDGKAYTQAAVAQLGNKALAAYAATQFYTPGVAANDPNFGQGQWYLPSIGEAMEMNGINYNNIGTDKLRWSSNGATKANWTLVAAAFSTLNNKGVDCFMPNLATYYWTSSESQPSVAYNVAFESGYREYYGLKNNRLHSVMPIVKLHNVLASGFKVGDVVYSDLSYGSASNYNANKTLVGVITWVSSDGKTALVMNKNILHFNGNGVGNFDPAAPYTGSNTMIHWATDSADITAIPNVTWVNNISVCGMTASCPTSYVTCEAPYEGVGEACDGKYASCSSPYVEVGMYNAKRVFIAKKDADSRMKYADAVSYAASVEDVILPDKELLQWVYSNKSAINSKLQANGGVKLGSGDCVIGRYWSSTKNGNSYAWALAVNGSGVVSRSTGEMSCVRLFQIQCPTSYVTCEAPYEGVGEACDGKYKSCVSYVEVGEYQGRKVFIAPTDADETLTWNSAISYVESKGAILPDKELLQWVYDNKNAINNALQANGGQIITPDPYWSSSEYNSGSAWVFYMNNYAAPKYEKKNVLFHVRAFWLK